jgi:hypothetical protein
LIPTPVPTDDTGPASSVQPGPTPTPAPTPTPDPAPLIIAKVDSKGTREYGDDTLLPGATFRIYKDDGDGRYDPDSDIVVFDGVAKNGFLVFEDPEPAQYWVIEIDAPTGYELARPRIVRYEGDEGAPADCIAAPGGRLRCQAAAAGRPGFVMLVVPDRPAGLPPTDMARKRR